MTTKASIPRTPGRSLRSPSGIHAQFTESAALRRLEVGGQSVLMYPADDLEAGPANLFLRVHLPAGIVVTQMLGPSAPGAVGWTEAGPDLAGEWHGLTYRVQFRLAEKDTAWFWHVDVTNQSKAP
ncbi:MAG TPA: hypothetical protein VIJ15_15045, partial [Dermatophilaceae bacterium]